MSLFMTLPRIHPPSASAAKAAIFAGVLGLAIASTLSAKDLHVSNSGNDENPGTLAMPFATVQRAEKAADAGDTVWIRGGRYQMNPKQIARIQRNQAHVVFLSKSGSPDKPIRYCAYADEKPEFDFSEVKPPGLRVTAFHIAGSWLHFKGISVTGVQVTLTGHTQSICFDNEGDHNVYEQLQMHDGQAIGFWLGRGSRNLVLNCDAYRNHDFTSENRKGGNVDGFGFHVPSGSVGNVFRGCRAWLNSDDGFDLITTAEPLLIENCWSFYNGFDASFKALGDGNGFKLGGYGSRTAAELPTPIPRHTIRQSLAARNRAAGFYANHQLGGIDLLNNSAYLNGVNFNLLCRDATNTTDVPGYGHKLKNNLGYKGYKEVSNLNAVACDLSGNSFELKQQLTDKDFAGLDEADLVQPRQANGDLPAVTFMKLKAASHAIDQGVDIGLPFKGKAPDLGAFEFAAAK